MKRNLFIVSFLFACQAVIFAQANLKNRLDALMDADFLKTSEVGIAVFDLTVGKSLYDYQAKKLYRPASIEKLITGITALDKLGVRYRFKTSLCYTGQLEDNQLNGDLYVIGGFDPEFADEGMNRLVDIVVQSGIKKINGRLYGDISMMDSLYWGMGWSWDDNPYYFQPYLSPLMYNKGYVEVTAHPAQKDSAALLTITPVSSYYSVNNQTKSKNSSAGKFEVTRNWLEGGNDILVRGNVASAQTDRVNMCTSQDFFMHTFRERLMQKGIDVSDYAFSDCPTDSMMLLNTYYHTLPDVLMRAMKKSDNLSAEAMFYHLAVSDGKMRVGSDDAVEPIRKKIKQLGFEPKNYRIVDGSGVSLYNYISPELLLAFLKYAYSNENIYEPLYKSLPIAGVDGTLRNRMKEGKAHNNVRAKTGSVIGVSSLAGYAKASNGHILAFVIINQNVLKQSEAKAFQNRFCEELCR